MASTPQWIEIEGEQIPITNPDKILWKDCGITKMEYLQHLVGLAPYLLPYCKDRYLTTIRYPHGTDDLSFYQKNCPPSAPSFVRTARLEQVNYIILDSLPTLLWLGNLACLEFHPSLHKVGSDLPEEWLIDLDPTVIDPYRTTEAANLVGETLRTMHIESVPKTSGATGIQIVVPIRPGYTFEQLREIGHFLALYMIQKYPRMFTIERLKKDRGDKIYFDYLQHWYGKTLSAPYTPRARPHAPVSTPLLWEELSSPVHAKHYHLFNIHQRLQKHGDIIAKIPPQNLDPILHFLHKHK